MFKHLHLLLVLVFVSCQGNHSAEMNDPVAKIDLAAIPKLGNSNIRTIEYIPLETNDSVLMGGGISKLIFHSNKFYLLDLQSNSIFIFNRNGAFHNRISRIGSGPGEYLQIQDFDIDRLGNRVWVYDNHSGKFIVYDESLTNYEEIKLPLYFEEFAIKGPDSIYVRNLYSEGKILHRVAELNTRNMKYKSLIDNSAYEDDFDLRRIGRNMFYRSGENLLFNPRFKSSVLRINNGKMENVYDVIAPFPDESVIEKYRKQPDIVSTEEGHALGIMEIFENESVVTSKILETPLAPSAVVYYKETKQSFTIDLNNQEKYFGSSLVIGVAENKFISFVTPSSNLHKDFYRKKIQESPLSEENKLVLLNGQPSDNPIIVLFDFVDF